MGGAAFVAQGARAAGVHAASQLAFPVARLAQAGELEVPLGGAGDALGQVTGVGGDARRDYSLAHVFFGGKAATAPPMAEVM